MHGLLTCIYIHEFTSLCLNPAHVPMYTYTQFTQSCICTHVHTQHIFDAYLHAHEYIHAILNYARVHLYKHTHGFMSTYMCGA